MRTSRVGAGTEHRQANLLVPAGSYLFGLAVACHIIKVLAIAELAHGDLVGRMAPTIQGYLTGSTYKSESSVARDVLCGCKEDIYAATPTSPPCAECRASACVCER
jgi:hypothetical protein